MAGVREIVRFESCPSLPGAPDFVRGVINLRGELVTLVDLAARFSWFPRRWPRTRRRWSSASRAKDGSASSSTG
ncbi:MAG: chemotaxis protein CheW [Synergistaceae bacterium]|nr:chemotaxis protein CheW [Synergistaceae bacterium]